MFNSYDIYNIKIYARHPQTPSRHRPDTPRHHIDTPRNGRFYSLEGTGRKGNLWVSWTNIICCQYIWYWYILRQPQTPSRHQSDSSRHHPDTPRHMSFYTIEGTGIKGYVWLSWPNFLLIHFVLAQPQTASDTIKAPSDTPRHHPDIPRQRRIYAIEGTGRKVNIWVSWPIIHF